MPAPDPPNADKPISPQRKKWWRRRLVLAPVGVLILLLILATLAPTFISAGLGRSYIQAQIDRRISGHVTIRAMSLGWLTGQRLQGVRLLDENHKAIVDVAAIDLPDVSLWSLLWGGRNLGRVTIRIAGADIASDDTGQLNLIDALALAGVRVPWPAVASNETLGTGSNDKRVPRSPVAASVINFPGILYSQGLTGGPPGISGTRATTLWGGLKARLSITGGHIRLAAPSAAPVEVSALDADLDLSDPAAGIGVKLDADMTQAALAGHASVNAKALNLFDPAGRFAAAATRLEGQVTLTNMPTALIDCFAGVSARYAALLGPALNLSFKIDHKVSTLKATSQTLACDISAQSDGKQFTVTPGPGSGAVLKLTVTPAACAAWTDGDLKLHDPFDISLDLSRLTLAASADHNPDPHTLRLDAMFHLGDILLETPATTDMVRIGGGGVRFVSDPVNQTLAAALDTDVQQGRLTGHLHAAVTLRDFFNAQGKFNSVPGGADLTASLYHLPMAAVDRFLAAAGVRSDWAAQAVGPSLDAQVDAPLKLAFDNHRLNVDGSWTLTLASDRVNAKLAGGFGAGGLSVGKGGTLTAVVTPALLAMLQKSSPRAGPPVVLLRPATFKLTIDGLDTRGPSPAISAKLSLDEAMIQGASDAGPITLNDSWVSLRAADLAGSSIKLAAHLNAKNSGQAGTLDLNASATRADSKAQRSTLRLGGLSDFASVNFTLAAAGLPTVLLDRLARVDGLISATLGPTLDARAQLQTGLNQRRPHASLHVQSANLTVSADAAPNAKGWTLAPDSHLKLTVSPAAAAAWGRRLDKHWPDHLTLKDAVSVSLSTRGAFIPYSAPGKSHEWSALAISGVNLDIGDVTFTGVPAYEGVAVTGLTAAVSTERLDSALDARLTAQLQYKQEPAATIVVTADKIAGLSTDKITSDLTIDVAPLPVALADAAAEAGGKLVALAGPSLDQFELKITGIERDPAGALAGIAMAASAQSDRTALAAAVEFHPGMGVALTAPARLSLTLTPDTYKLLFSRPEESKARPASGGGGKKPGLLATLLGSSDPVTTQSNAYHPPAPLQLDAPVRLTLNVASASAPFFPPDPSDPEDSTEFDFDHAALKADIGANNLILRRADGSASATINHLSIGVDTTDLTKSISLGIKAQTFWQAGAAAPADPGSIDSSTTIQGLAFDDDNHLDWTGVQVTTHTAAKGVATMLVDQLLMQKGKLAALLGPATSLTVEGSYPGDMAVAVNAVNLDFAAQTTAGPDRVLTLRKDSQTSFRITPETVEVLGKLNPEFLMLKSALTPVHMVIHREGFIAPLMARDKPFDLAAVKAKIDLTIGPATVVPGGTLLDVWRVLDAAGLADPPGQTVDVRFTPLHAELADGVIKTNDMWMIAQPLVIGTQGRINLLAAPAPTADMTLGISGQTLNQIKGLRKIPANYILESPLRGPVKKLKLDAKKLSAALTLLAATAKPGLGDAINDLEDLFHPKKPKPGQTDKLTWPNQPTSVTDPKN